MQSRLIVKNFGPIEFVDLDLRNVNVFIGPQASGKSALAKIYTIVKAPRKFLKMESVDPSAEIIDADISFKNVLEDYNVSSFLLPETEIEFESELHTIQYKNGKIKYEPKLLKKIVVLENLIKDFSNNKEEIIKLIIQLSERYLLLLISIKKILKLPESQIRLRESKEIQSITQDKAFEIANELKEIDVNLSTNTALYIPSERNFINIIKNSSLNLLLNNVPIPKHILAFGAEVEKAIIKEIDLGFLQKNLSYKNINGEDRIFTNEEHSIKLTEAASGIQSALPILIPILSKISKTEHRSFVIEEPELNLFPIAQYELIKTLESSRFDVYDWDDLGTIHTYTTHSPYILSAINNLLYAFKVNESIHRGDTSFADFIKSSFQNINEEVGKILKAGINPMHFTAYQICDGKAESIFDRETGLIKENYIDEASDKMADDFDALMNLMQ